MQGVLSVQSIASGLVSNIIAIRNCESKVCLIISYVQGGSAVCRKPKADAEAKVWRNTELVLINQNMFAFTDMAQ